MTICGQDSIQLGNIFFFLKLSWREKWKHTELGAWNFGWFQRVAKLRSHCCNHEHKSQDHVRGLEWTPREVSHNCPDFNPQPPQPGGEDGCCSPCLAQTTSFPSQLLPSLVWINNLREREGGWVGGFGEFCYPRWGLETDLRPSLLSEQVAFP